MYIKEVKIENFRGLNLEIDNLEIFFTMIGKNDSGKTNFCYAIRKVLDPNIRRIPITEYDSTFSNKKEIKIYICLNVDGITDSQRTRIGNYIDKDGESENLYISLIATYNQEIQDYEEKMFFGRYDKDEISVNRKNELDEILNILYIEPSYDYEKNQNLFFKYNKQRNESEDENISVAVKEASENLNEAILKDKIITKMSDDLNKNSEFNIAFDGLSFRICSTVDTLNIYKSLRITQFDPNGKEIVNIGDGKNRILSFLLKKLSFDDDKNTIIIVEEPENHLYPMLQKTFATLIESLKFKQVIITTHSPFIVNFEKTKQIVKIQSKNNDGNITNVYSFNINKDDFNTYGSLLNEEISQMLFYDKVLLVEGYSEEYFYDSLSIIDKNFLEYLHKESVGIYNIFGVNFKPIYNLLNDLGIKVMIKTDNDINKVPYKNSKCYTGLSRVIEFLNVESINKIQNIMHSGDLNKAFEFDVEEKDLEKDVTNKKIEDAFPKIQKVLEDNNIYLSKNHKGFEEDFIEYVGKENLGDKSENVINYLKEKKLKNLHQFIVENNINIKIREENKNSILVKFINNE